MLGTGTSINRSILGGPLSGSMLNVEINNSCGFTDACGPQCVLAMREVPKSRKPMPPVLLRSALHEAISLGYFLAHLIVVGKEPTDSPEILFGEILEPYHTKGLGSRPQSVGIVTHGLALERLAPRFRETPLSYCLVSIDDKGSTGLRTIGGAETGFKNGLHLREKEGTTYLGVNSVLTEGNLGALLRLGKELEKAAVDQWGIGLFLSPKDGQLASNVSDEVLRGALPRIVDRFGGSSMPIVIEVTQDFFRSVAPADDPEVVRTKGQWRWEYTFPGTRVQVASINPGPGYFLRLRYDGMLLSLSEMLSVGLDESRMGSYKPRALLNWANDLSLRAGAA